jgi:hypothetical protein
MFCCHTLLAPWWRTWFGRATRSWSGPAVRPMAACPECATVSSSVHGRYWRPLIDSAVAGSTVRLGLLVRRFRCRRADCDTVTFAEQFDGLTVPHVRYSPPAGDHGRRRRWRRKRLRRDPLRTDHIGQMTLRCASALSRRRLADARPFPIFWRGTGAERPVMPLLRALLLTASTATPAALISASHVSVAAAM